MFHVLSITASRLLGTQGLARKPSPASEHCHWRTMHDGSNCTKVESAYTNTGEEQQHNGAIHDWPQG